MLSKTHQAIEAFNRLDFKEALRISSGFRIGMSKEERATLKTGYECIVHRDFYQQLQKDTEACVEAAVELFREKFLFKGEENE